MIYIEAVWTSVNGTNGIVALSPDLWHFLNLNVFLLKIYEYNFFLQTGN